MALNYETLFQTRDMPSRVRVLIDTWPSIKAFSYCFVSGFESKLGLLRT